jgi:hypothetical protein
LSRLSQSAPSLWHAAPEDERAALEAHDTHAGLRNALRRVAADRSEWAGIPMPLESERLVIEPAYPNAAGLMAIGANPEPEGPPKFKVRNEFNSTRWRCDIVVFEEHDGRIRHGKVPAIHHLTQDLRTLGCADAWGVEQESAALDLLASMVQHRQFRQYLLTGMFIESSPRSGVTYLFRRLKPTVAMHAVKGNMRVLCALCLHPIAYYSGSWAGAMTPTDDVVAHLSLMRGDEPMFWRRANQHAAYRPEAGL